MNVGVRLVVPPDLMTESDELNLELSLPRGYAAKKRWGNFSSPSRKARQGKPRKKWFGWSTLEVIGKESRKNV